MRANLIKFITLFCLVILGVSFYASAQLLKPDWVKTGYSKRYPEDKYLIGIGSANSTGDASKDRNAADDLAKAKLIEQIRVSVESELNSYISEQDTRVNLKTKTEITQLVSLQIKSKVSLTLEGLQFPERYYDPVHKIYYSLAVLDRAQASSFLLDKARELRQNAEFCFKQAETQAQKQNYFVALKYYQKSFSALTEAIAKEQEASVILGKRVSFDTSALDPWMLQTKIDEMKEKLKVGIYIIELNPLDPGSNVVASAISQAFRQKNIKLGSVSQTFAGMSYEAINQVKPEDLSALIGEKATFLVFGRVEAKKSSELQVGSALYHFYKSRADLKMINIQTGELIANISFDYEEDTKSAKSYPAQAAAESLKKAGELLAEKLLQSFDLYLNPD